MTTRTILIRSAMLAIGLGILGTATPALADRCAGPISAEEAIRIARTAGLVRVTQLECDDGKWEVEGRDAAGREIEVEVDPRTGAIIKVERD
jgi:uncharacterized membrane protein YkoI